ncbi:helix-turn-helix domain-containing protein [Serratia nevei]|uniref:helix-turn-helix domain-containing protein n=1 Tax=Serratia nevei TaxID=2703794 RepID=UPI00285BD758|nr:helix-turn-helix domain-containing protein [Serratia nevei]MDR8492145.1 helix-turn-helix domain-containing protein [Serratia nevei]
MFMTKVIEELLAWAEDNGLDEKLTIEKLSDKSGYSKGYIQKSFKDRTGQPFCRYVRGRKLTRAAFMLKASNLSISDILKELNFSSYQCFERAFRKQFRTSPLQYRKKKTWDMSSVSPLLSISGIPEHKYVNLPQVFDESGNYFDIGLHYFNSALSDLRRDILGKLLSSNVNVVNFFRFKGSDTNDNNVSIYLKHHIIHNDFDLSEFLLSIAGGRMRGEVPSQQYAEFTFTGDIDKFQDFKKSIYVKSFPINKIGWTECYFIEVIRPIVKQIMEVKIYVPIALPMISPNGLGDKIGK